MDFGSKTFLLETNKVVLEKVCHCFNTKDCSLKKKKRKKNYRKFQGKGKLSERKMGGNMFYITKYQNVFCVCWVISRDILYPLVTVLVHLNGDSENGQE